MGQGPEELRAEIERTRQELAADADAIANKVDPRKAVKRKVGGTVDSTRGAAERVKERVMGVAGSASEKASGVGGSARETGSGLTDSASSAVSGVQESASQAVSRASETSTQAVSRVKSSAQGSPLAAGAVAFALGWFAASLVPASEKERTLAGKAVSAVASGEGSGDGSGGGGQAKQALTEIVDNLKEPVAQAAKSVGSTAQEAAKSTATASVETAKKSGS